MRLLLGSLDAAVDVSCVGVGTSRISDGSDDLADSHQQGTGSHHECGGVLLELVHEAVVMLFHGVPLVGDSLYPLFFSRKTKARVRGLSSFWFYQLDFVEKIVVDRAICEVPVVEEIFPPHRGEYGLFGLVVEAQDGVADGVEIDSFFHVILNFVVEALAGNALIDEGGVFFRY